MIIKRGASDEILSCLSHPSVVAMQVTQLNIQPGHQVPGIGAGRGYNAAVLAYLVGPQGHVTTIDVDADIAAGAFDQEVCHEPPAQVTASLRNTVIAARRLTGFTAAAAGACPAAAKSEAGPASGPR